MAKADKELQHDVIDELDFDPSLDASGIGVAADNGIVTLTGSVPTYAEKLAAEEAVTRVAGVKGIANELEIDLPQSHIRDDTDIAHAAVSILEWDTTLPRDRVTVEVSNGFVKLEGQLDWQFQKERAKSLVQSIAGVRGVTDRITVKPRIIAGDVKTKIRQAFQRSAEVDADRIQVETGDGVVTLRGTVHSWVERADATRAAYSIPGVRVVENFTQVS
jgi:osmotically-inducible protein OsmY